jgi:hypothetical protein
MRCAVALLAAALAGTTPAQGACLLDLEQSLYDGGTSARTLPGYSTWQSFTPTVSGRLCRIEMGFFNDMAGQGRLDVREGSGTAGAVLFSAMVPVVGITAPGPTWNAWDVDAAVTAASTYTFQITPDAATLPDPYGVCIGSGDPYAGGTMGIDDPSGSYEMPFDVVFRIHLDEASPAQSSVFRATTPIALLQPANVVATAGASPHDDPAPPAAPLLFYAVSSGPDAAESIFVTKLAAGGVRLDW